MKNLQDAGIDNVFFSINPVEKCTQSFLRCYVSDVVLLPGFQMGRDINFSRKRAGSSCGQNRAI
jgi:hypothetical protein